MGSALIPSAYLFHRNMLLNYLGKPSLQLPIAMMVWGMISCLTGGYPATMLISCRDAVLTFFITGVTTKYASSSFSTSGPYFPSRVAD